MSFTPLRIDPTTGVIRQYGSAEDLGAWGLIENGGGLGYVQGKYPTSNHLNFPLLNGWLTFDESVHSGKPDRGAFYGSVLQMSAYNNVRAQVFVNATSGLTEETAMFVRHTGDFTTNTSLWAPWAKVMLGDDLSVSAYGAVGDYDPATGAGTDDRAAIQAALDACFARGGGRVRIENRRYKIGGVLDVPVGVTFCGPHARGQGGYMGGLTWAAGGVNPETAGGRKFRNMTGSIWVCFDAGRGNQTQPNRTSPTAASNWSANATYDVPGAGGLPNYATRTAAIYVRGCIEGIYIFQASYDNNQAAAYTDSATFNAAWNSGTMAGVALRFEADDATARNCFIGGFEQAGIAYLCDRVRIEENAVDCINGFELSSVLDVPRVRGNHGYPYCAHSNSTGTLVRRGTFLYLHDTVDWAEVVENFCYGWKVGLNLTNVFGASVVGFAADNQAAETAAFYGVFLGTNTHRALLSNVRAANREFGITVSIGAGNSVLMNNISTTACNIGVNVGSGELINIAGMIASAPGAAWNSATAYNVGDFASLAGTTLYRCIVANTNKDPSLEPTYWVVTNSTGISNGGATYCKVFGGLFTNCINATGGSVSVF